MSDAVQGSYDEVAGRVRADMQRRFARPPVVLPDALAGAVASATDAVLTLGSALLRTRKEANEQAVKVLATIAQVCEIGAAYPEQHEQWRSQIAAEAQKRVLPGWGRGGRPPETPDHATVKAVLGAACMGVTDRDLTKTVMGRASDYGATIGYWRKTGQPANRFERVIAEIKGPDAAKRAYREQSKPEQTPADRKTRRKRYLTKYEPIVCPGGPMTKNRSGYVLFYGEITDKRTGAFLIRRARDLTSYQVERLIDADAARAELPGDP